MQLYFTSFKNFIQNVRMLIVKHIFQLFAYLIKFLFMFKKENTNSHQNINTILTDDCLHLVFQNVSLKELICLRKVCQCWKNVSELAGKQRKKLVLANPTDQVIQPQKCLNIIYIKTINCNLVQLLLKIFPNISNFQILNCQIETDLLVELFSSWTKLDSVSLQRFAIYKWEPVWNALNNLPQLKQLYLKDMELFDYVHLNQCKLFPVLNKLNKFSIDESMPPDIFVFVEQLCKTKKRILYFTVSTQIFELDDEDHKKLKNVKEEFEKVISVYRLFENMIPDQYRRLTPRGIYNNIPVCFAFKVVS